MNSYGRLSLGIHYVPENTGMTLNALGTHEPGIARLVESPNGLKPWVCVLAEIAFDPQSVQLF